MTFAVGQRWISETENNLGLGIIQQQDSRTVTIFFPSAEETRIYAINNAPLARVQFHIGDTITHQEGWLGEVLAVQKNKDVLFYLVKHGEKEEIVAEMELAHSVSFSRPQERLFSAQIDRNDHFTLRYHALQHQQAQSQSPLRGLRGIRASLIPHQLHIAKEVGQRIAPRVLLADEVGVGKTIEAGMILQQQLFAEKVRRVLVIVPETLQHQWLVEMLRRFNLKFSLFDEERCADFIATEEREEINPFTTENLIICALDWLVNTPKRVQQILSAEFDMLIVDEVHHLRYDPQSPSTEYQLVAKMARAIPSVLLLTATPEQLGQLSHFARLNLLDRDRFYDYDAFLKEQEHYQPIAEVAQILLSNAPLSAVEKQKIFALAKLAEQNDFGREEIIKRLIDLHGTSRVLFRNTRQSVKGFPIRQFCPAPLTEPIQYIDVQKTLVSSEENSKDTRLYPEYFFGKMYPNVPWWEFDPRFAWLVEFLKTQRNEKILVICRYADTAIQLEQALREKEGIRSAVFHEKMSIVERDRASAYFTQQENGAQVLLSSHIGSEGRNFQFARHLVLFSVPENPDLLEQCIGRLDRIGQKHDIQIHQPYFINSAQAVLVSWYDQGLNAYQEICPMGAVLFEKFGTTLEEILEQNATERFERCQSDGPIRGEKSSQGFRVKPTALEALKILITQTQAERERLKILLEQGRDLLLELNSSGGKLAQNLATQIAEQDNDPALVDFALNVFDVIGVEQEDLGERSIVITPTGTMLMPDFPGLKEEGVTVTFDRQFALAREDVEFLTWDHPMIINGIDLILSGDLGKTAVALLPHKKLPAGTAFLELIYVVEAQAPFGLQISRFLPATPVRLLLDTKGNNLGEQVPFEGLQSKLKVLDKNMANKVAKMLRPTIEKLIQHSENVVAKQGKQIISQAQQQAERELNSELQRLIALQQVNKNIRNDEIITLRQQQAQILTLLQQATWRLDSLRVIVTN